MHVVTAKHGRTMKMMSAVVTMLLLSTRTANHQQEEMREEPDIA